jgi:hypothetical protein
MKPTRALLIFAKAPKTGRVKTRLHSAVPPPIAAQIHAACFADTLRLARSLPNCDLLIFAAGGSAYFRRALQKESLGHKRPMTVRVLPQRGRDLGERLENAHKIVFARGYRGAVVIGTDSPWMGKERVRAAFAALRRADIVIGPAEDGGYFLLGTRRKHAELFREIPWSTDRVSKLTIRAARSAGLRVKKLPRDFDLDRPEDLHRAQKMLLKSPHRAPALAKLFRALK